MKSFFYILFLLLYLLIYAQNSGSCFTVPKFKWKIQIPKVLKVDHEEWARFQGKGEQALEKMLDRTLLIKVKRYLT
jgi:hypothetical protein